MPDQVPIEAMHETLEAEMRQLAIEVKKNREHPELKSLNDQELLKRSIESMEALVESAPKLSPQGAPTPQGAASLSKYLPQYAQNASNEVKLEIIYLVDIAFKHGIVKANALAKKSTPFVIDAFHDVLTGKLYPELKKRGLL